jgi:hypothetical protein
MKRLITTILFSLLLIPLLAPVNSWWTSYELRERHNAVYETKLYDRELDRYACHLGWVESRMNWKIVNKHGYMGTWQHGTRLLKDLGLQITPEAFTSDNSIFTPDLQYRVLKAQIKAQKIQLLRYEAWIGTEINGVTITRAGMLAGAHLGGIGAVRDFLYEGIDRADSNGTRISQYMKEFGIYNL